MVVDRGIAPGDGLEAVIEIEHDLVERNLVGEHDTVAGGVFEPLLHAALLLEQFQNPAQVVVRGDHGHQKHRLLDLLDRRLGWPAAGVIDFHHLAIGLGHTVAHAGRGGDQAYIKLPLQALLHDLQVQQAQEAAAKPESERCRALGLELERAVIELQLFQGIAQQVVLVGFDRI